MIKWCSPTLMSLFGEWSQNQKYGQCLLNVGGVPLPFISVCYLSHFASFFTSSYVRRMLDDFHLSSYVRRFFPHIKRTCRIMWKQQCMYGDISCPFSERWWNITKTWRRPGTKSLNRDEERCMCETALKHQKLSPS